jgi:pyruvate dehydrogenase E2 component (dihydrolipoamide acetyltransferase)
LVAILVDKKSDIEAFKNYSGKEGGEPTPSKGATEQATTAPAQETKVEEKPQQKVEGKKGESNDRVIASPLAKKTARENGVDLHAVTGTGPHGRIIQADVLEAKSKAQATPQVQVSKPAVTQAPTTPVTPSTPSAQYEDIELSNVRKVIADRLLFSKTNIPHFYVNVECNVDKLMEIRAELNKYSPVKISVNDIVIKAASLACMKVPETNSSWQGSFIRKYKNVDMSVAVQTENGLITPIIPQSNLKGLADISKEMTELRDKAKQNKLKPHEFMGGTFTISNMGMMNITSFSAIINPPQSCILAVGKSEKRVVFDENAKNKEQPYK